MDPSTPSFEAASSQPPSALAAGGVCALHGQVPAVAVCPRCGSFMCEGCGGGTVALCPSCRERVGWAPLPFDRESWEPTAALSFAIERFKEQWKRLVPLGALMLFVGVFLSFVTQLLGLVLAGSLSEGTLFALTFASSLFINFASYLLQMMLQLVAMEVVQGKRSSWGALLVYVLRRFIPLGIALTLVALAGMAAFGLVAGVVIGVAFLIGSDYWAVTLGVGLVLGVPTVLLFAYVGLRMAFINYEMLYDPSCGPIEAIRRSWRLTKGQWWRVFFAGLLTGLTIMAGYTLCLVGIVGAMPLAVLNMTVVYFALRRGTDLPEPASR